MPSYTQLAADLAPALLPAPAIASDPDTAERWFLALPPAVREKVQARLAEIIAGLPEAARLDLARYLALQGEASPVPLGVEGLGCAGKQCSCGCPKAQVMQGLGQWGALITGLAQVGTSIYEAREMKDLQSTLADRTASSNERIASAQIAAAQQTQELLAQAQLEAARAAGAASVDRARVYAPWVGGAVVLAAVGGFFLWRSKRR